MLALAHPRMKTALLAIALLASALPACSEPKVDNTMLGSADLVAMTDQMVASLLNAPAVAARDAASEPWAVTMDRVVNRTNHVMPQGEKLAFLARLRALLNQSDALGSRNIRFVMSADNLRRISGPEGDRDLDGRLTNPTHALTATFYAQTSANRSARSDYYLCTFQLTDASSDAVVWEDSYQVRYAVMRNKLD